MKTLTAEQIQALEMLFNAPRSFLVRENDPHEKHFASLTKEYVSVRYSSIGTVDEKCHYTITEEARQILEHWMNQ